MDSESKAVVGFSRDGGRATTHYLCTSEDLVDSVEDLLGYTEVETSGGKLRRHLPRAHPRFAWLFVERINNIQGIGRATKTASADGLLADPIDYGASYTQYKLQVEFTSRPYAVLPDSQIVQSHVTWKDDTGANTVTQYAPEWKRYTVVHHVPGVEIITGATHAGSPYPLVLRTNSGADPNLFAAPGAVTLRAQRRRVVVTWVQVPYRYVTSNNSYLANYAGYVNQTEWLGFQAGTLLFLDAGTTQIYPPPFPELEEASEGAYANDLFCDVQLNFEYVVRTAAATPPTPANGNWIAAGHNLLPWLGVPRGFYYATAAKRGDEANTAYWVPPYLSRPFQLLFTDPEG